MLPILCITAAIISILIAASWAYFQAASQLSWAENWLLQHRDLHDIQKNRTLTRRLIRAVLGRECVRQHELLRRLRRRFYVLLMVASIALVWGIGLLFNLLANVIL